MTMLTAWGRDVLAAQPISNLLGSVLTSLDHERAELSMPITDTLTQHLGVVHGGVLSYLVDNALTFAAASAFGGGAVTGEIKVNYIRPAIGDTLIARAWLVSAGRRQAVTRCDLFVAANGAETLCAAGQGTIVAVQPPPRFPFPRSSGMAANPNVDP